MCYPPTSPERRACETQNIKIIRLFQNPIPDSQAQQPKAASHQPRQPSSSHASIRPGRMLSHLTDIFL